MNSVKGCSEEEIATTFLKSYFYDLFQYVFAFDHSKIIILYTSYITQVSFTLNLFTKYIVILRSEWTTEE